MAARRIIQKLVGKGKKKKGRTFSIWYRHSGENEIALIPSFVRYETFHSEEEITARIGNHYITHMAIENGDVPHLDAIAPKLTHLTIKNMNDLSQLLCISELRELKVLDLSYNDFSAGLPEVVGEIKTLNRLYLTNCELRTLPESLSQNTPLRKLFLSDNDFSGGLPEVIGEIVSLNKLFLDGCKLTTLPGNLRQLTQLRKLSLSSNNFSAGLPDVIGEIGNVNKLYLSSCELTDLPESMKNLRRLTNIDLGTNMFEHVPPVVFKLVELQRLQLQSNLRLTRIDDDFLQLTNLNKFPCSGSRALVYPPYAVCEQGLAAVRKYFQDIQMSKGIEKTVVPVAVIGQSMSGKTSLIRSLQSGKRTLTYRETNSELDETTKVFQVEDLPLAKSQLKLIDFGGNDVYHVAYKMMLKEQYLPLIVVNLEEYSSLSTEIGPKEATKKVCLDWLAHPYLSCPRLGRPALVITHVDKLSTEEVELKKNELLKQAEELRHEILRVEDERRQKADVTSSSSTVNHLSNLKVPLFAPEDTFEFGSETLTSSNLQSLKENLEQRAEDFNVVIPRLWEELASYVHSHIAEPYLRLSDVVAKYSGDDCLIILRYMHNIGDILWFENIDNLQGFLFHQLPELTKMITVLFDHCSKSKWKERLSELTPFRHGKHLISKEKYEKLIDEFFCSGVIDKALLFHLFDNESKFPPEVALELLKCFTIVHGPVMAENGEAYSVPFLASIPKDESWKTDGMLRLRIDMVLGGLTLPKYVYQLITVTVLNQTLSSTNTIEIAKNGATVYHGESTTHLIHEFQHQLVTLQISTPVELLSDSWKRLLENAKSVFSLLAQEWQACYASFKFYCSHCLFLKDHNPDFDVDPSWFRPIYECDNSGVFSASVYTEIFEGIQPVTCRKNVTQGNKPTVPKPLRLPCYKMTGKEVSHLADYLNEQSKFCNTSLVAVTESETGSGPEARGQQVEETEEGSGLFLPAAMECLKEYSTTPSESAGNTNSTSTFGEDLYISGSTAANFTPSMPGEAPEKMDNFKKDLGYNIQTFKYIQFVLPKP